MNNLLTLSRGLKVPYLNGCTSIVSDTRRKGIPIVLRQFTSTSYSGRKIERQNQTGKRHFVVIPFHFEMNLFSPNDGLIYFTYLYRDLTNSVVHTGR